MARLAGLLLLSVLAPWSVAAANSDSTVVDLGYAKYQGAEVPDYGVTKWLGMRYADAPLGDLRWRTAREPSTQTAGIQMATEFQPTCLGSTTKLSATVNEDCLFVNVWAPSNATVDSKLPVWFFIQGGGYAANSDQNFNASTVIAASNHSMIFVQINYRVGAFGFLASEKVRDNGDLNVGLLDQRVALHWTQKYIHLFGGDPDHVVIHGDSAGAGSIAYQLTAYGGRDDKLFVGAMAESPFWPTHRQVSDMEFQFDLFAKNLSCPSSSEPDVMTCLRCKTTEELQGSDVTLAFPGAPGVGDWYWLPVVDGNFSTDLLYNLFEQEKFVKVPVVVGDDTDEGTGFVPNTNTSSEFLDVIHNNYPKLTQADLERINETYPEDGFGTFPGRTPYFAATQAAYGEATFTCPGLEMSRAMASCSLPSWNYRYNVQDEVNIANGLGVPHVSEKPAIFGVDNTAYCNGCSYETYNAAIVPVMMSYWISFIVSLDPNAHKVSQAPTWEMFNGEEGCVQRLKIQTNATAMESVPSAQLDRCALWKGLAGTTEQK